MNGRCEINDRTTRGLIATSGSPNYPTICPHRFILSFFDSRSGYYL